MEISKEILIKFFEGKQTSFETKMIEGWLQDKDHKELYLQYLNEWEVANPQISVDTDLALKSLYRKIENRSQVLNEKVSKRQYSFWSLAKIAAGVVLAAFIANYYFVNVYQKTRSSSIYQKNVESIKLASGDIFEKQNVGEKPLLVNLPDGSSVLLQPQAKISYNPKTFGLERREVILSGDAFFEVFKEPRYPFVVYANEIIAKALGTSFTIKASSKSGKTEVFVKSGHVAVFTQKDLQKTEKTKALDLQGLVLIENQKVEIKNNDLLEIPKPEKIQKDDFSQEVEKLNFNFEESNANEVFGTLERAYNIDIVYDKNKFSASSLTAHLGDEPLKEKLKLICLALEVSYREVDGKIIILTGE